MHDGFISAIATTGTFDGRHGADLRRRLAGRLRAHQAARQSPSATARGKRRNQAIGSRGECGRVGCQFRNRRQEALFRDFCHALLRRLFFLRLDRTRGVSVLPGRVRE